MDTLAKYNKIKEFIRVQNPEIITYMDTVSEMFDSPLTDFLETPDGEEITNVINFYYEKYNDTIGARTEAQREATPATTTQTTDSVNPTASGTGGQFGQSRNESNISEFVGMERKNIELADTGSSSPQIQKRPFQETILPTAANDSIRTDTPTNLGNEVMHSSARLALGRQFGYIKEGFEKKLCAGNSDYERGLKYIRENYGYPFHNKAVRVIADELAKEVPSYAASTWALFIREVAKMDEYLEFLTEKFD